MIRIGILDTPRTGNFIYDLIDEVEIQGEDVEVELAEIDAASMNFQPRYHILIDRLSHLVPFYRSYLKTAMLNGCLVINNPFWFSADDKFFNNSVMQKMGIALPKTVLLPPARHPEGFVPEVDLQNLPEALDWQALHDFIGFPAVLKPYDGKGWQNVFIVQSPAELAEAYEQSGELVMMLQEFIEHEQYIRCMTLGRKYILPMAFDPKTHQYSAANLSPELEARIIQDTLTLVNTLGYDMNTVEWAVRDGVPYAIDFMNPIPDFTPERITDAHYQWVVKYMAQYLIETARELRQGQSPFRPAFTHALLAGAPLS